MYAARLKPTGFKIAPECPISKEDLLKEAHTTYQKGYKQTSIRRVRKIMLQTLKFSPPPYHKLVSVSFLLIWFAAITRIKLTTELNKPTAAEKEYCLFIIPIRYTYVEITSAFS